MSNYTKNTNFTAKDNLTSGDPAKVIKGAEFDTEFNAIQTAVNSKADSNNSQLTGTTDAQAVTTTGDVTVGGNLSVTGNATVAGNLTFGDAATDTVSFSADIDSSIIPETDNAYDLGSPTQQWRNVYVDGTANIDSLVADTADINGGTIDGVSISGSTASFSGEISANGGIALGDNDKATFGASDDLQIYHDGSGSYVDDQGAGGLILRGTNLFLRSSTNENYVGCIADGTVTLYYDQNPKLATTSTGVDVTGTVTADGLTVGLPSNSGNTLFYGGIQSDRGLKVEVSNTDGFDNSAWKINASAPNSGSSLTFATRDTDRLKISHNGDLHLYENTGTTPKLTWDASAERLGIGTTVPDGDLDIRGAGLADLVVRATSANSTSRLLMQNDAQSFALRINGDDKFRIKDETADADRLVVDTSGNIGIGTVSPSSVLTVDGTNKSFTSSGMTLKRTGVLTGSASLLLSGVSGSEAMSVRVNDTERMRIDSSGNVGIGVTTPQDPLHVAGDIRIDNADYYVSETSTGGAVRMLGINSGNVAYVGGIDAGVTSTIFNASSTSNVASFYTAGSERMRIDSSGNLLVGTTSATNNCKLKVSGATQLDGAIIYTKQYTSLDTTGENVAGLLDGYNGQSAVFEFTGNGGGSGGAFKILFNCYNAGGTWQVQKNNILESSRVDIEYSSGVFTFKSKSGTQSYLPRVKVEITGSYGDTSYFD